jgi:hypothetical protein
MWDRVRAALAQGSGNRAPLAPVPAIRGRLALGRFVGQVPRAEPMVVYNIQQSLEISVDRIFVHYGVRPHNPLLIACTSSPLLVSPLNSQKNAPPRP